MRAFFFFHIQNLAVAVGDHAAAVVHDKSGRPLFNALVDEIDFFIRKAFGVKKLDLRETNDEHCRRAQ